MTDKTIERLSVVDIDRIEKEKLERDIAKAQEVQKRLLKARKEAPEGIFVGVEWSNPMEATVKRLRPNSLARPLKHGEQRKPDEPYMDGAEVECLWLEEKDHKKAINKGYVPVLDEGAHASCEELRLYERDIRLKRDEVSRSLSLDRMRLAEPPQYTEDAAMGGGGEVIENTVKVSKGEFGKY